MITGFWGYYNPETGPIAITVYTGVVVLLAIICLAGVSFFLIKRKRKREMAERMVQELLSIKKKADLEEGNNKKRPRLVKDVVLYESFFIIGIVISIIGYLSSNWALIAVGVIAMLLSLPLLELVLKRKITEDPEEAILRKAEELIKKEKRIAKKEHEIRKEIDRLYDKAIRLMAIEKEVKILREKNRVPEEDIKRVLKISDELLEKLPDEEIERFLRSKDFQLYQKVMKRVK